MKLLLLRTLCLGLLLTAPASLHAAITNTVPSGDGLNYTINGQPDPTLTLVRGVTYVFQLGSLPTHPFNIRTSIGGSQFNTGVTGNGSTSGNIIFVVPTNAPDTLAYQCGNHFNMAGAINIINPPTPPPFTILGLSVSNNIRLRHTGTNAFTYTPEFTTNLVSTNWVTLTIQSNVFTGGTNEIFCGRPPGSNVFFRVRAQ